MKPLSNLPMKSVSIVPHHPTAGMTTRPENRGHEPIIHARLEMCSVKPWGLEETNLTLALPAMNSKMEDTMRTKLRNALTTRVISERIITITKTPTMVHRTTRTGIQGQDGQLSSRAKWMTGPCMTISLIGDIFGA